MNINPYNNEVFAPVGPSDVPLDFKNLTVAKINEYVKNIIDMKGVAYDKCLALKSPLTFKNLILPFINLDIAITNRFYLCYRPSLFYTDKTIREASTNAIKELQRFIIKTNMRKDLFEVFKQYYNFSYPSEKSALSEQECRFVEKQMRNYKKNGLHLSDEVREEVEKLKSTISSLENEFSEKLTEDTTCFYFTREELAGMPESWFKDKKANEESKYKLTLKYPDIHPALDYLENRDLRKKLCIAFNSRPAGNESIFNMVIQNRKKLAKLLGFESFAHLMIEGTMANTPENVLHFLNDLNEKITPLFNQDMKILRDLAREKSGDQSFELKAWDLRYYLRIHKEKVSQLNLEELKKFFPIDVVTQGLFKIYQGMLGLKFIELETDNKWDDSVKYFEVYDYDYQAETQGKKVGAFFLDMFPRDGKYGHAAAFGFIPGYESNDPDVIKPNRLPLATMACNFPKTGCIPFEDVETFFHEFGHIMHYLCSGRVQIPTMDGLSVEKDFLEIPSQMFENWVYELIALKLMSGNSIDDATIQKITNSRHVMEGYLTKRQLQFAFFDMALHTSQETQDANALFAELYESTLNLPYPEGFCFPASFDHLMSFGYSARLYAYLWGQVNAVDMYYERFKKDPLSAEAGKALREEVLNPGASKDPMALLRKFLGREPSNDHYLRSLDLSNSVSQK